VVELPVLGALLGEVLGELLGELLLEEPVPDEVLELPLIPDEVPPAAPDLSKWASHSAREIWPSLLVSTDEKLGDEALLEEPPAEALPDDMLPDEPLELLSDADGEDTDGEEADGDDEDDDGLLDDDEDCATANVERAKSTAAVVTLRVLGMEAPVVGWTNCSQPGASAMPQGQALAQGRCIYCNAPRVIKTSAWTSRASSPSCRWRRRGASPRHPRRSA
jgi:hypothetical protein